MNVLEDFLKNTLLKQPSFDLHQLSAIYLKKKFCYFTYTLYLFIAQNEEVSPGFLVLFFCFYFCALSLQMFWVISPRFTEMVHFLGDLLAGKLGGNFVFCAVVVTIFCSVNAVIPICFNLLPNCLGIAPKELTTNGMIFTLIFHIFCNSLCNS